MTNKYVKEKLVLKHKVKIVLSKFLVTIIIFLIALICIKKDISLKDIIKENIYEKSIKFSNNQKLYNDFFGEYLSIERSKDKTKAVFNEKINYSKEEKYGNGVKLTVEDNYLVPVLESGVIVYIGQKEQLGNTVIVEQTDGIETIYSNVNYLNYKLYDYVEKGELIGEVFNKELILQFQKNGEYLDYKKLI